MTLTREQIIELERTAVLIHEDSGIHVGKGYLEALCKLALAGLSVQPKPIQEAPELEPCLIFSGSGNIMIGRVVHHPVNGEIAILDAKYNKQDIEAFGEPIRFIPFMDLYLS